jgi:hypothetical protein
MRSSELAVLETRRAIEQAREAARTGRQRRRKAVRKGWDPQALRAEVEGEFRAVGARVIREEVPR